MQHIMQHREPYFFVLRWKKYAVTLSLNVECEEAAVFLVQVEFRQMYYATQVRPDQDLAMTFTS